MKQLLTRAIVLSRTDYGEADRIITVLTPDHGKLSLMARGVRRQKSKLAGGIELFSTSDMTYIKGRGEVGTLISTRLNKHYANIVKDINRVQLGYTLIKMLSRATEDQPEAEYYALLEEAFKALDNPVISVELIRLWFQAQLLRQAGHSPNLQTDATGKDLKKSQNYNFDFDTVAFTPHPDGNFKADHIKFLRLLFSGNSPKAIARVQGNGDLIMACAPLIQTMLNTYIRL